MLNVGEVQSEEGGGRPIKSKRARYGFRDEAHSLNFEPVHCRDNSSIDTEMIEIHMHDDFVFLIRINYGLKFEQFTSSTIFVFILEGFLFRWSGYWFRRCLFTWWEQDTCKEKWKRRTKSIAKKSKKSKNRSKNSPNKRKQTNPRTTCCPKPWITPEQFPPQKKTEQSPEQPSDECIRQCQFPTEVNLKRSHRPSLPNTTGVGRTSPLLTMPLPLPSRWSLPLLRLLLIHSLLHRCVASELLRIGLWIGVVVGIVSQPRVSWHHPGGWARKG